MRGVVVALVALFSVAGSAAEPKVPLKSVASVAVGRHTLLPLPTGVKSAVTADPKIATAQVLSDSEVLLTGVTRGRTTLLIKNGNRPDSVYELSVEAAMAVTEPKAAETIALGVGNQKSFVASDLKRIAVGDPKIADVSVIEGKEILVTGVAPGRTSLLVWRGNELHQSFVVKVEEKPLEETMAEIRELLGPMEGVRLRIIGERIFMDGELEAPEDLVIVKKVCGIFSKDLVCL